MDYRNLIKNLLRTKYSFEDRQNPFFYRNLGDTLLRLFKPNRILDIGCGKGIMVKHLVERGMEAFGIDLCLESDEGFLRKGDARNIPFPDNFFDLVVSFQVLEHIPECDSDQVVSEMIRVCKPGGFLAGDICVEEEPPRLEAGHINVKPMSWWKELFKKHGLKEKKIYISCGSKLKYTSIFEPSVRRLMFLIYRKFTYCWQV